MKLSLGKKLTFGGLALAIIPLLIVGLFSIFTSSKALVSLSNGTAASLAQRMADMTQLVMAEEVKLIKELAIENTMVSTAVKVSKEGVASSESEIAALDAYLGRTLKELGQDYESLFLADLNGKIVADSQKGGMRGMELSERAYFKIAKSNTLAVGEVVKSKATGQPVAMLAAPVRAADGQVVGVLGVCLYVEFLNQKIAGTKFGHTGYAMLVDGSGTVIAHPNKELVLSANLKALQGMEVLGRRILAGESGVEDYVFKGVDKIAGFAPVPLTKWAVMVTQDVSEFMAPVDDIRNGMIIMGVVFLGLALLSVYFLVRSIARPIDRVVAGLAEGAAQVSSASTQVSASSQQLAEGASEQAAALEETSSSLEELASMTKQNADNAHQADGLTKEASVVVNQANASMQELTSSMKEISVASEEISKIIKTIDEIAFQTNLLALNAAVEAARAGEAGAGFAVVAEEVRNLAMRAGDAAKNTANLIEGTVHRIKAGADLVDRTNDAFAQVATTTSKVAELVGEIAAASGEQSQGIDQINKAVTEMDKVTQTTAASAEETASAAEEMNSQAESMKDYVGDLMAVVQGSSGSRASAMSRLSRGKRGATKGTAPTVKALPSPGVARDNRSKKQALAEAKTRAAAQQAIPLGEDDFKDF